jgi:hypothetical protein
MVSGSKYLPFRYIAIIGIMACLLMGPAFFLGAGGNDLRTQTLWIKLFNEQFWQGDLYPRWLQNMYAGNGSPAFFYYPPLTYFITAFFSFLAPLDAFGYYPIAASALLGIFISGIAFYIWMKEEGFEDYPALIGSLLYMAVPDHVAQNFYHILLFSSLWAYAWIPLLFMFAKKLSLNTPYAIAGFALSLCLLIITNIPMTLLFGPVVVAYNLLFFKKEHILRQYIHLIIALLLGFGLSAFYLAPSIMYVNFSNIDIHWNSQIQLNKFFLAPSSAFLEKAGFYFHMLFFDMLSFIALALLYIRFLPKNSQSYFFLSIFILALFLMLPISRFVWEMIPILNILQFAERFFAITSLCITLFALLSWPKLKWLAYSLIIIYVGITFIAAANTRVSMDILRKERPSEHVAYMLNIEQYGTYLTTPDLITLYSKEKGIAEIMQHRGKVETIAGDAIATIEIWHPRSILIHYQAQKHSALRIRQFDFPGFRAFLGTQELEVTRDKHTGQILIDTPSGSGIIRLELTSLLPEKAGKIVSFICAALLLLLGLIEIRKQQQSA